MKRLLALILAFASLTAAAQYVPGQKNYGNYNIYGSQWINGDLKLQKCIRSKSDTLIIFTTAAGVVDTVNWRYLSNIVSGANYFTLAASALHPTDTTNAVAIGTNSAPAGTMLRVNDGSVLFDGTTGTTPVSGAGTRFMWIGAKGALRAGMVTGTQWNDGNIGNYSIALGNDSYAPGASSFAGGRGKAYGAYSFAFGDSCRTSTAGSYGVAMGYGNKVTGQYGVAFGNSCEASNNSLVIGVASTAKNNSIASGYISNAKDYSIATGYYNTANNYSSSFGLQNISNGAGSLCSGTLLQSDSYVSSVFGRYNIVRGTVGSWVATEDLFVLGNGTGTGANSNNALTILKNGTAYIGDASSTTDPILTVSTTDSTISVIGDVNIGGKTYMGTAAFHNILQEDEDDPYYITDSEYTLLYNVAGGTVYLPDVNTYNRRVIVIKSIKTGCMVEGNGTNIDGGSAVALTENQSIMVQSDGVNWWIIAKN